MNRSPPEVYLVSATTAVTISPMHPTVGKANDRNQCPPVAQLIYRRYSPMAAKSIGTNMTGFGRRNHTGSTDITYMSSIPPEA